MTDELPRLPPRSSATHKGDYGHVLVTAGSVGMTGAAVLTTEAALRAGAGLVTLACPTATWPVLASHIIEALVKPVGPAGAVGWSSVAAADVERIASELDDKELVLALGPGVGRSDEAQACVRHLVDAIQQPLVLDADGIVAFAGRLDRLAARSAATVLTPHPGEAAHLDGTFDGRDDTQRLLVAKRIALGSGAIVVLKGHRSVITDGARHFVNATGNPGMATGGSGDVLTGVIAGFIACGLDAFDAARLGCHLHGLAGDLAAREVGQVSLVAGDIVRCLPAAIMQHQSTSS